MQFVHSVIACVSEACCSQSFDEPRETMEASQSSDGGEMEAQVGTTLRMADGPQSARDIGDTGLAKGSSLNETLRGEPDRSETGGTMPDSAVLVFTQALESSQHSKEIMGRESESRSESEDAGGTVDEELLKRSNEIAQRRGSDMRASTIPAERPQSMAVVETEEASGSDGQVRTSVKLVTSWCSPFAQRIAISLRQKGVQFVMIEENVLNKNDRTLNANPMNKKIPILMHRGRIISESRVIMEYVDEAWVESPIALLPKDPFERSAARYWGDYIDVKITQMLLRHIGVNEKEVYGAVNDALIGLNKAMTVISHGQSYFMGDKLGFVDIVFAPMIPWLQALRMVDDFRIPNAKECPRLHEWFSALQKDPSVRPSLEASTPKKLRAFIVNHFRKRKVHK